MMQQRRACISKFRSNLLPLPSLFNMKINSKYSFFNSFSIESIYISEISHDFNLAINITRFRISSSGKRIVWNLETFYGGKKLDGIHRVELADDER